MMNWRNKELLTDERPEEIAAAFTMLQSNAAYRLLKRNIRKQVELLKERVYMTIEDQAQVGHHNRNIETSKTLESLFVWEEALMEELKKKAKK